MGEDKKRTTKEAGKVLREEAEKREIHMYDRGISD